MELAGRYRLVRRLASGGMGEVWEAAAAGEHGFSRRVAIKRMVPDGPQTASFTRMFLDEARIASQLHHANIVSILDFGVADGVPFQVLEFVDGTDAYELERMGRDAGKPLPVELALHICAEIGHALHYAHEATGANGERLGIVHRDVSPQNILVSWTGDVKLTDFGIALARGRLERTIAGITKGKPAYMAPEQATGGEVDPRTDVFALGCVLHALAGAGLSPLAGENRMADLLAGVELPLNETVPPDVREIVARAVKRSKHLRFESAAAFAEACGRALHARIDRDARTVMREYIEGLRGKAAEPPSASAFLLDPGALVGFEETLTTPARPEARRWSAEAAPARVPWTTYAAGAGLGLAIVAAIAAFAFQARSPVDVPQLQTAAGDADAGPPVAGQVPPIDSGIASAGTPPGSR